MTIANLTAEERAIKELVASYAVKEMAAGRLPSVERLQVIVGEAVTEAFREQPSAVRDPLLSRWGAPSPLGFR